MKNKLKKAGKILAVCLMVLASNVVMYFYGVHETNKKWMKQLISMDMAEYNSKTAEWQFVPVGLTFPLPPDLPQPETPKKKSNRKM